MKVLGVGEKGGSSATSKWGGSVPVGVATSLGGSTALCGVLSTSSSSSVRKGVSAADTLPQDIALCVSYKRVGWGSGD